MAHELARQALLTKVFCTWDDDLPSFIVPLLANDVTLLNHAYGFDKKKKERSPRLTRCDGTTQMQPV